VDITSTVTLLQVFDIFAFKCNCEGALDRFRLICGSYSDRQVSIEEGDAKAREFGVMFIETSAKAGFNIKVSFL
jgi:hypothetical protein